MNTQKRFFVRIYEKHVYEWAIRSDNKLGIRIHLGWIKIHLFGIKDDKQLL